MGTQRNFAHGIRNSLFSAIKASSRSGCVKSIDCKRVKPSRGMGWALHNHGGSANAHNGKHNVKFDLGRSLCTYFPWIHYKKTSRKMYLLNETRRCGFRTKSKLI
jgi:hypothetical protein